MAPPALDQSRKMASAIAALSMDAVEKAASGHPGMPMGMADVATVLFSRHLKFDPTTPDWHDRDRFVLSAGHGSMLLYSLLYLTNYADITIDDLKNFRQLGARTAGHPEYGHLPGVETTTGPLGQGIANAVGMAMAEAHLAARFGDDIVDHHTYVIAGDGCLMEGISQEAIAMAGHMKLRKLIVLWDDNKITIDGAVSLADSTDQKARFEASGWLVLDCDGHDQEAVDQALTTAKTSDRPVMIACRTVIGKGADKKAGSSSSHGSPLGEAEIAHARKALDWPYAPFEVPDDVLSAWRAVGAQGQDIRQQWEADLKASPHGAAFLEAMQGDVSPAIASLQVYADECAKEKPKLATRKASENTLGVINKTIPFTIGGSADLSGSNNTRTSHLDILDAENMGGRYVHYGIREHAMAAAMNGLALHGGVVPYGGTFLVFADYCRPSMRLAALMGLRVIYVMTHDSIGLGEDGPTHQPVEHLASLRAIPNLAVFRPGDAVETAEAWSVALARTEGPSVLALTRQAVSPFRGEPAENRTTRGGYVVDEPAGARATIIATGSEMDIAMAAKDLLAKDGLLVRVVSVPCLDLLQSQSDDYIQSVVGTLPRLVIEAGVRQGWDGVIHRGTARGDFLGVETFGASGPYKDVYEHFELTAAEAASRIRRMVKG